MGTGVWFSGAGNTRGDAPIFAPVGGHRIERSGLSLKAWPDAEPWGPAVSLARTAGSRQASAPRRARAAPAGAALDSASVGVLLPFFSLPFEFSGEGKQTTLRTVGKRGPGFSTRGANSKNRGAGTNEFVIASQRTRAKSRGPMTGSAKQSRAAVKTARLFWIASSLSLLAMSEARTPHTPNERKPSQANSQARNSPSATRRRRVCCGSAIAAVCELWRRCDKPSLPPSARLQGRCVACLKRALPAVPHAAQWQTRQEILAATPKNIGAPERAARQCMPLDFYIESTAQAVAEYLAKFNAGSACATMKFSRQRQRMRVVPALFGYRGAAASR